MKLIKQPNGWSCGIAAMAMLLDVEIDSLIKLIGHDGSEVVFPDLKDPDGRKTFHPQEFVDTAFVHGHALVEITAVTPIQMKAPEGIRIYDFPLDGERRLGAYMSRFQGLIIGQYSLGVWHAVAWDGERVYDPMEPRTYTFDDSSDHIMIASFYALMPLAIAPV